MMAIERKQLNEARRVWLDRDGHPIDVRASLSACNEPAMVSRRTEAMLAGAGQDVPSRRWYVLRIAPRCETSVDNALHAAAVEHWLPSMEVQPKRRGRRSTGPRPLVSMPIWPGYLFVKVVNTARSWAGLSRLDGVLSVLGTAERPAPIADDILLKLKVKLAHDEDARDILVDAMKTGQRVRVTDGPFASFEGVVQSLGGFDRAKVEVGIFGRECLVDLELAQLTKIG